MPVIMAERIETSKMAEGRHDEKEQPEETCLREMEASQRESEEEGSPVSADKREKGDLEERPPMLAPGEGRPTVGRRTGEPTEKRSVKE